MSFANVARTRRSLFVHRAETGAGRAVTGTLRTGGLADGGAAAHGFFFARVQLGRKPRKNIILNPAIRKGDWERVLNGYGTQPIIAI
jgi:hypothetical protein